MAKAFLAIWTGVYLVLPSCMCQMLGFLQIFFPNLGTDLEPMVAGLNQTSAPSMHCHCHESVLKSADLVSPSGLENVQFHSDWVAWNPEIEIPEILTLQLSRSERAPPDLPVPHRPIRQVSCVFQV